MKKSKFVPKSGQVDYSKARWAPTINCIVKYKDKFLIVQRSKELRFYPGLWNGVSGYLDDQRSLKQKVVEELKEELGISKRKITRIRLGKVFDREEPRYKKTWIVHPVLVEVTTDTIKLDWEAQNYAWVDSKTVKKFKLVPGLPKVFEALHII